MKGDCVTPHQCLQVSFPFADLVVSVDRKQVGYYLVVFFVTTIEIKSFIVKAIRKYQKKLDFMISHDIAFHEYFKQENE